MGMVVDNGGLRSRTEDGVFGRFNQGESRRERCVMEAGDHQAWNGPSGLVRP